MASEATPAPAPLADLIPAPLPVLPAASRSPTDGGQCRKTCAREYYFCLSADDESSCSPVWVKCQARCGT